MGFQPVVLSTARPIENNWYSLARTHPRRSGPDRPATGWKPLSLSWRCLAFGEQFRVNLLNPPHAIRGQILFPHQLMGSIAQL
jgi:hypothetical protein